MDHWETARDRLEQRLRHDGVIAGSPESIAHATGFTTHEIEEGLADLIRQDKVRPFQDAHGVLEYQWKAYQDEELT